MSAERHLRIPPFAKSAKDGADTAGRTDVFTAVAAWGTRSTGDGGRAQKQFGPVSHPIEW